MNEFLCMKIEEVIVDYNEARLFVADICAKGKENIGLLDLYSYILADELQAVINMITTLEQYEKDHIDTWEYSYLLGQAIGSLDASEAWLIYFGQVMGTIGIDLQNIYEILNQKLITLHPE